MPTSIQLPDWVGQFFGFLSGDAWPEADEGEIFVLGDMWHEAADELENRIPEIVAAGRSVLGSGALKGDSAAELENRIQALVANGGQGLAEIASNFRVMGDYLRSVAVNIQYAKLMILGQLAILAAQIAWLIGMAVVSGGASLAGVAALQYLGRWTAGQFMKQLLYSIASGVAFQVALDAAVQGAQFAMGDRKQWDTGITAQSALTGVIGGGVGTALGFVGNEAAGVLSKQIARNAARIASEWGLETVEGAATEFLTEGVSGAVTGQGFTLNWAALTAGGLEDLVTSARQSYASKGPSSASLPDAALTSDADAGLDTGVDANAGVDAGSGSDAISDAGSDVASSSGSAAGSASGIDWGAVPTLVTVPGSSTTTPGGSQDSTTTGAGPVAEAVEATDDAGDRIPVAAGSSSNAETPTSALSSSPAPNRHDDAWSPPSESWHLSGSDTTSAAASAQATGDPQLVPASHVDSQSTDPRAGLPVSPPTTVTSGSPAQVAHQPSSPPAPPGSPVVSSAGVQSTAGSVRDDGSGSSSAGTDSSGPWSLGSPAATAPATPRPDYVPSELTATPSGLYNLSDPSVEGSVAPSSRPVPGSTGPGDVSPAVAPVLSDAGVEGSVAPSSRPVPVDAVPVAAAPVDAAPVDAARADAGPVDASPAVAPVSGQESTSPAGDARVDARGAAADQSRVGDQPVAAERPTSAEPVLPAPPVGLAAPATVLGAASTPALATTTPTAGTSSLAASTSRTTSGAESAVGGAQPATESAAPVGVPTTVEVPGASPRADVDDSSAGPQPTPDQAVLVDAVPADAVPAGPVPADAALTDAVQPGPLPGDAVPGDAVPLAEAGGTPSPQAADSLDASRPQTPAVPASIGAEQTSSWADPLPAEGSASAAPMPEVEMTPVGGTVPSGDQPVTGDAAAPDAAVPPVPQQVLPGQGPTAQPAAPVPGEQRRTPVSDRKPAVTGRGIGVGQISEIRPYDADPSPTRGTYHWDALVDALLAQSDDIPVDRRPDVHRDLVDALDGRVARWTDADQPDTYRVRELLRSDGVAVDVNLGDGTRRVRVRLEDRGGDGPERFWADAQHVADFDYVAKTEEQWADGDMKDEYVRIHSKGLTGSVGLNPAGTEGRGDISTNPSGGVNVSSDSSRVSVVGSNYNLSAVTSNRGHGVWAAFEVPSRLTLTIDDPPAAAAAGGPARQAAVPVMATVRFPWEMTVPADAASTVPRETLALPPEVAAADGQQRRRDVFSAVDLGVESADLGDLSSQVQAALHRYLTLDAAPGTDRAGPDSPVPGHPWVRNAVSRIVDEANVMRNARNLGAGLVSTGVAMGDRVIQLRFRGEVTGNDGITISRPPEPHRAEATDKNQHAFIRIDQAALNQSVSATFGRGLGWTPPTVGPDSVAISTAPNGSVSATAQASGRRQEGLLAVNLTYPKSKIIAAGSRLRVDLPIQWSVEILDQSGPIGEVTVDGGLTARILDGDEASLREALALPPVPALADPAAGPSTGAVPAQVASGEGTSRAAVAAPVAPRALVDGRGLGSGIIDQLAGASEIPTLAENLAQNAIREALANAGPAYDRAGGARGGTSVSRTHPEGVAPDAARRDTGADAAAGEAAPRGDQRHPWWERTRNTLTRAAMGAVHPGRQTMPPSQREDAGIRSRIQETLAPWANPAPSAVDRIMPRLRSALNIDLSPRGMRALQGSLTTSGITIPLQTLDLPGGELLKVTATVKAVPQGAPAPVGGLQKADMEYGREQWRLPLRLGSFSRTLGAGGSANVSLQATFSGRTADATDFASIVADSQISSAPVRERAVDTAHGPWLAHDPHLKYDGATTAWRQDVTYEVDVTARVADQAPVTRSDTRRGHMRVQVPESTVGRPDGADGPVTPSGDAVAAPREAPAGRSPLLPGERVLELRENGGLHQAIHQMLNPSETGAGRPASEVTARLRTGELRVDHAGLNSHSLGVHLRNMGPTAGLPLPVLNSSNAVVGTVTVNAQLRPADDGPDTRYVKLGLNDEGQQWQQVEVTKRLQDSWSLTRQLIPQLGVGVPAGSALLNLVRSTTRSGQTTVEHGQQSLALDRLGRRVTYPHQARRVDTHDVDYTFRFTPIRDGQGPLVRLGLRPLPSQLDGAYTAPSAIDVAHMSTPAVDVPTSQLASIPEGAPVAQTAEGASAVQPGEGASVAQTGEGASGAQPGDVGLSQRSSEASGGGDAAEVTQRRVAAGVPVGPWGRTGDPTDTAAGVEVVRDMTRRMLERHGRGFLNRDGSLDDGVSAMLTPEFVSELSASGSARLQLLPGRGPGRVRMGVLEFTVRPDGEPVKIQDHAGPQRLIPPGTAVHQHTLRVGKRVDRTGEAVTAAGSASYGASLPGAAVGIPVDLNVSASSSGSHTRQARNESAPVMGVWSAVEQSGPFSVYEMPMRVEVRFVKSSITTPGRWLLQQPKDLSSWIGKTLRGTADLKLRYVDRDGNPAPTQVADGLRLSGDQAPEGLQHTLVNPGYVDSVDVTQRFSVPRLLDTAPLQPPSVQVVDPAEYQHQIVRPHPDALRYAGMVMQSFDSMTAVGVREQLMTELARQLPGRMFSQYGAEANVARDLLSKVALGARIDDMIVTDGYPHGQLIGDGGVRWRQPLRMDVGGDIVGIRPIGWGNAVLVRLPIPVETTTSEFSSNRGGTWGAGLGVSVPAAAASLGVSVGVTGQQGTGQNYKVALDNGHIGLQVRPGPQVAVSADMLMRAQVTRSDIGADAWSRNPSAVVADAAVRADDAAVFYLDPAVARELGVTHPAGELTGSGWHVPTGPTRPADSAEPAGAPRQEWDPVGRGRAEGAQRLPSFEGVTVLSGQATTSGGMVRWGQDTGMGTVLADATAQGLTMHDAIALVASDGMGSARQLAAAAHRPVIATDGVVTFAPDGQVTATRPWTLVHPPGT